MKMSKIIGKELKSISGPSIKGWGNNIRGQLKEG
jgi:hypothetical protein